MGKTQGGHWRFEIETPNQRQKFYDKKQAHETFNDMARLWARQTGQTADESPADLVQSYNDPNQPIHQIRVVTLFYVRDGNQIEYGDMILWEYVHAQRTNATSGKRSGRRSA